MKEKAKLFHKRGSERHELRHALINSYPGRTISDFRVQIGKSKLKK